MFWVISYESFIFSFTLNGEQHALSWHLTEHGCIIGANSKIFRELIPRQFLPPYSCISIS